MDNLLKLVRQYVQAENKLNTHECEHSWCPHHDSGCAEALALTNEVGRLFTLLESYCGS